MELPSVIQDEPGQPLRRTRRMTYIDILKPVREQATLFEMGIPIQKINLDYDVDVLQKVPLNPNRNTVSSAYLRAVSAEVLNEVYSELTGEQAAGSWIRSGIEDKRIEAAAVREVISRRYGRRVVMWSPDKDAVMRAAQEGYEVLHPRSMSPAERENMRNLCGLKSAAAVFGRGAPAAVVSVKPDKNKERFAAWVVELAAQVGLRARVEFIYSDARVAADCTANTANPTVRFNTRGTGVEAVAGAVSEGSGADREGDIPHLVGEAAVVVLVADGGNAVAIGMAAGLSQGVTVVRAQDLPTAREGAARDRRRCDRCSDGRGHRSVRRLRCMDRSVERHVNAFLPRSA